MKVFDVSNPENNKVSVTVNFIGSPPSAIVNTIQPKKQLIVYPNPCNLEPGNIRFHESGTVHVSK